MLRKVALILAAAVLTGLAPSYGAEPEYGGARTEWLYKAKTGIMFHFSSQWFKMGENWQATIAGFDVPGLVRQMDEAGMGYLLITARHGDSIPIAPSAVYEKGNPGKAPKRDLIADLAAELEKHGKHLMLYYSTGMGVEKPKVARESAAFIREYSLRYGAKVKGWWLDNNVGDPELQKLLADAARAGNPDALVAFSPPHKPVRNSPYEDYTAGNTHAPGEVSCGGRWVDGTLQWHMLTYLGNNWGGYCKNPNPRWPDGKVAGFAGKFLGRGGVITWDVPYETNGLIRAQYLPVLRKVGDVAAGLQR